MASAGVLLMLLNVLLMMTMGLLDRSVVGVLVLLQV